MEPKTIIITGASDGIGAAAARQLAAHGHRLILTGRSPDKLRAVADELGAEYLVADFSRLDEVRNLAAELLRLCPQIDVLANNAGLFGPRRPVITIDGHELTDQVDYLAPFLLNHLLHERLVTSQATVIATSSIAHWFGRLDFDHQHRHNNFIAYGTAKLSQLLHTRELQRRYGDEGLTAVAFHPGLVSSNFSVGSGSLIELVYASPLKVIFPTSPTKGAETMVFLAEAKPEVDFQSGGYYVRCRPARTRSAVSNSRLATELWQRTEEALGIG